MAFCWKHLSVRIIQKRDHKKESKFNELFGTKGILFFIQITKHNRVWLKKAYEIKFFSQPLIQLLSLTCVPWCWLQGDAGGAVGGQLEEERVGVLPQFLDQSLLLGGLGIKLDGLWFLNGSRSHLIDFWVAFEGCGLSTSEQSLHVVSSPHKKYSFLFM